MLSDNSEPGFDYFLNTPCQVWDAVRYHEAWEDNHFGLDKATLTRSFQKQLQIIKPQGTEEQKENATRLENQFNAESKKTGLIDNFWMKRHILMKHESMKVNSIFLSCDGVQIGCTGNNIQGQKRSYENRERSTEGRKKQKPIKTTIGDGEIQTPERQIHASEQALNSFQALAYMNHVEDEPSGSAEEEQNDGSTKASPVMFPSANRESESSKERRLLDGHNHGRKPDFRILSKIDDIEREFMFGEIKPPHCPNNVNRSIIKLAEFMKGSSYFIINIYGYVAGLETYGILICGKLSLLKLC
ncbi:10558_t:CDS:2 [Dentiscutata erythropus]|uniref:10558_t:CDS:1 n=1 Tax=Dentiscutata erythropus TaxID=1348616 RepID=A0A9N9CWV7_9GLOM|nr:10558_t:CDS:2 [Dentiscutata erythropus]